ncbi:MAG: NAD(P)/FAD-dependent oxidoreductase [Acidobacteriota bacterium]|nr:NAD(P)/FAD-dependent oxidoreductase [Acidobacteriota bacterium]
MQTFPKTDVFIVGGGPVGLTTAIAARRRGFRVTVADAMLPPIDKACGEGVMPDGLAVAARLGLQLPMEDSFQFRGICFHGDGVSVSAEFASGGGRGFRRTALHQALVEQAQRCGVEMRWGCSVPGLKGIDARWIVGADGSRSQVRGWAHLDASSRDTQRYGFRRHFRVAPWNDHVEIHWGKSCQIYITPIGAREVCVALISRDPKLRLSEALRQFPALCMRLGDAPENSRERGAATVSRRLRRVTRGNIALIGDASGSVDAISGEGLCLGFHQAIALANAMERKNLAEYEIAHRRLARRPRFMADLMLAMDRSPLLRKRALHALVSHPELFKKLLAMHVGASRPSEFAASCITLGWRVLRSTPPNGGLS